MQGFDIDDDQLTPEQIKNKYPGKILEEKAKNFIKLSLEGKKEILYSSISGEKTDAARELEEATAHSFIIQRALFFFKILRELGKYEDWVKRSVPYKTFVKLPLDEKRKYQNALEAYHDKCMKESGHSGKVNKRVLDSSPTFTSKNAPPNFDDKSKWKKV
jgi:hypothetical protein